MSWKIDRDAGVLGRRAEMPRREIEHHYTVVP
jgi:hypothetical protein